MPTVRNGSNASESTSIVPERITQRPIHKETPRFASGRPCIMQFDKADSRAAAGHCNNAECQFKNRILNSKEHRWGLLAYRLIDCANTFFKNPMLPVIVREFIPDNIFWFGRVEFAKLFVGTGSLGSVCPVNRYFGYIFIFFKWNSCMELCALVFELRMFSSYWREWGALCWYTRDEMYEIFNEVSLSYITDNKCCTNRT
jgi:hypothetical protein